jgi:hypothetical protein
LISIRSEWVESGNSIAEIFEQLKEIYDAGEMEVAECPLLEKLGREADRAES